MVFRITVSIYEGHLERKLVLERNLNVREIKVKREIISNCRKVISSEASISTIGARLKKVGAFLLVFLSFSLIILLIFGLVFGFFYLFVYDSKDCHQLIREADYLVEAGEYDGAIHKYYLGLIFDERKSTRPYAYIGLARCYEKKGDYKKAREMILKLHGAKCVQDYRTAFVFGKLYLKEKKFVKSKKYFKMVINSKNVPVELKAKCREYINLIDRVTNFEIEYDIPYL